MENWGSDAFTDFEREKSQQLCCLCPDCTDGSEWEPRGGVADDESREQRASPRPSRSKRSVRKPSVQTETKYIELMVVNDNDMVRFKIHVSN